MLLELHDAHRAASHLGNAEAAQRSAPACARLIAGANFNFIRAIYVSADCLHEPAVSYLGRMGDQQNWLQQSDTELSVLVAEMPLAAGAHQLALLFFDNHDRSHALRVATASAWQRRVACDAMQNHKASHRRFRPC